MKKKIITAVVSAVTVLGAASLNALSAGGSLDLNADGTVDSMDAVNMRQLCVSGEAEEEELSSLVAFVMGHALTGGYDSEYTIDESAILEPKGTVHTGEGTFYGGGYEGGCAMLDPISREDYWIVAMNLEDYNNAQLAGAYLEVTGELGTINMLVTDLLPEGKKGDLDLYVDAFPLIAPAEKGRVPVSWRIIPLDSAENAPVCYKFKEGTTQYWCGVQVRNHRYPITKLEYLNENGEFVELPRQQYNYFESMEMGAGPFTFRITDIYGQVIIDEDIPLQTDDSVIVQGSVQFPE